MSFAPSKERWSGSGMKCIHIDAHVNTCVLDMFRHGAAKINALTNYFLLKTQHMLRDHFVFHKKSISILKSKQYKAWRGKNNEVPEYTLPVAYHVDEFKKMVSKLKEEKEKMGIPEQKPVSKEEIKMPTFGN